MSNNSEAVSGGIGLTGLVTTVFIVLKLTDYNDWSWWWVLSPLWLPWVIILGVVAVGYGLYWAFKQLFGGR